MQDHLFLLLGFCLLLTHEMDAVRVGEWKMFPLLSRLRDDVGYLVFTALHVPLYAVLIWGIFGGGGMNLGLIVGFDAFFVVHAFLHLLFVGRPNNRFGGVFSWVLILGTGASGVADLLMRLR